jgi:hypothetical protein
MSQNNSECWKLGYWGTIDEEKNVIKTHGADHCPKHRLLQRGIPQGLSSGQVTGRVKIPSYYPHSMQGDTGS